MGHHLVFAWAFHYIALSNLAEFFPPYNGIRHFGNLDPYDEDRSRVARKPQSPYFRGWGNKHHS